MQLGLLPGAGGVVRSVRMLGIVEALMQLLMQGQRVRPDKGKELGIVDELVSAQEELAVARFVRALNDQIKQHAAKMHRMEFGNVTQVSPLLVLIDGSQTSVPCFSDVSYTPTLGDRVYLHIVRNQNVVAGAIH